jgi:NADPH2:quinone reductase
LGLLATTFINFVGTRIPLNRITMQSIRVHQFGGPEVLVLDQVAPLKPAPDEVLIEVKAVGVNPVDAYIRYGQYAIKPHLPYTPGLDAAGIVKAVGLKITRLRPGNRVYTFGSRTGAYAQEMLCTEAQIFPLPWNLTFQQGACVGVPYATAYRAFVQKAKVRAKQTVLIHGASGGVGIAAVQLAKHLKCVVLATAGSDTGRALVLQQGASAVFDHTKSGYLDEIKAATNGRGVDVILELRADVNLGHDLTLLATGGCVVVVGSRGEVTVNPRDLMSREGMIIGMVLMNAPPEDIREIHRAVGQGLANQSLKPVIAQEFALKDAALAHEKIMKSGAAGKIVLIP